MEGKVGVGAAKSSDEVVFEDADGAFGLVAAVCMGGNKLKIYLIVREEVFEER